MFWLHGYHPTEPPNWRTTVEDIEQRVSLWARGRLQLAKGEVLFEDKWVAYKVTFSRVQRAKCAYCEMLLAPDAKGGDIEHYRPKGLITKLLDDPKTWGTEVDGHNSRDEKRVAPRACKGKGYWWLAYAWDNYLLSCGTCNEKWKGNLFPIEGGHLRAPTKKGYLTERPLLLNPYGDVDPTDHLEFNEIGQISPRNNSVMGLQTIRTCHLTRESLRFSRSLVATQAWPRITRVLRELGRVSRDEQRLRKALAPLLNLGLRKKPHAGMVRAMWKHRDPYGFTWEQLRALHEALKQPPGAPSA
jgi:hypothetical protein